MEWCVRVQAARAGAGAAAAAAECPCPVPARSEEPLQRAAQAVGRRASRHGMAHIARVVRDFYRNRFCRPEGDCKGATTWQVPANLHCPTLAPPTITFCIFDTRE